MSLILNIKAWKVKKKCVYNLDEDNYAPEIAPIFALSLWNDKISGDYDDGNDNSDNVVEWRPADLMKS